MSLFATVSVLTIKWQLLTSCIHMYDSYHALISIVSLKYSHRPIVCVHQETCLENDFLKQRYSIVFLASHNWTNHASRSDSECASRLPAWPNKRLINGLKNKNNKNSSKNKPLKPLGLFSLSQIRCRQIPLKAWNNWLGSAQPMRVDQSSAHKLFPWLDWLTEI